MSGGRLGGVFAAVLTPFDDALAPDGGRFAAHCRWLLDNGCDGLAVFGTTGEANSLSVAERMELLDGLAASGIEGRSLLVGTGCCAVPDTVELTRHAVGLGAGGVLMLPPFYYKGVSDDGLFAAYSEVIERVGDRGLKVYLYHFPKMSGVPISLALIERLLKAYPGTVVGLKDSSGDLDNMTAAVRAFPGFAVFSGVDHLLAELLDQGGAGCITAVCNVAAPLAAVVYRSQRAGNAKDGEEANRLLSGLREIISAYPLSAALKEIIARHGDDETWLNIRPPLRRLSADEAAALLEKLNATGYDLPAAGRD